MASESTIVRGCQLPGGGWGGRIAIDPGDVRQTAAEVFGGASELFQVASALVSADAGGLPALNFSTHGIRSHMAEVRRGAERLGDEYGEYAQWLRREADYWERLDGGGWFPGAPWWSLIIPGEPRAPWEFPFFLWPSPIRPWPRPLPPGVCPTLPPKPVVQGGHPEVSNAAIVEAARNHKNRSGECAVVVMEWLNDAKIPAKGGATPAEAWRSAGGVEVPYQDMQPGDVIQVGNPNVLWNGPGPYGPLHTAIITNVHRAVDGSVMSFDVIESNANPKYPGVVGTRPEVVPSKLVSGKIEDPVKLLVYRFGKV